MKASPLVLREATDSSFLRSRAFFRATPMFLGSFPETRSASECFFNLSVFLSFPLHPRSQCVREAISPLSKVPEDYLAVFLFISRWCRSPSALSP